MILGILEHALMITSFVFIMMLLIEYINVQTQGRWQEELKQSRWGQYLLGAVLGAMPGCLGAFTVVSLYSHRIVSFGALVATMIATSGDEAFVMFSLFPARAAGLTAILLVTGIITGFLVDVFFRKQDKLIEHLEHKMPLHDSDSCQCFPKGQIWNQLKSITFPRALLIIIFFSFMFFLLTGTIGPKLWDWKKITFAVGALYGLFIVTTVPDHFLEHHLWEHVFKKHLTRIFLWTFGALVVIHFIEGYLNLAELVQDNYFMVLVIAVLIGIIPESGPHLLFVTLYSTGVLPFSILLASSIVQDGHGMLPLLAVSRRGFVWVKLVNILVGLVIGSIGLVLI
ncbi:MAG: arsenic efflux protein [Candidatus Marinimicrobia bacterium]|nr:arsenic efflux protein [Candidatus Neomarinimicrobiota bacterium]